MSTNDKGPSKETSFVLRSIRHGETSRIVTLFSQSRGKFAVIAKGARKVKSGSALGSISPPSLIEAIVFFKPSRSVQILGQVSLIDGYSKIKKDLSLMAYAAAILQIIERSFTDAEPNQPAYRLLIDTLAELETSSLHRRIILWQFELKLLEVIGFLLNPLPCPICNSKSAAIGQNNHLMLDEGAICCTHCDPGSRQRFRLSGESVSILRLLSNGNQNMLNKLKPSERAFNEISTAIEKYMKYHHQSLGKLTALKLLEKLG